MRRIWATQAGPPEVLEVRTEPDPVPPSGHVRIRVRYAGVNFADVLARMGRYTENPEFPCVLGYEVVGSVDALGAAVDDSWLGRRVIAPTAFGGYSDVVTVSTRFCFPLPDTVQDAAAAALTVNYLTAHHIVVRTAHVQPGETVLVHAAAGGVGTASVQLCRMIGARVIGTASPNKHELLTAMGVEPVDYRTPGWPERVRAMSGDRGVHVALDPIGGSSFETSYGLLAPGGRLCCFGDGQASDQAAPSFSPRRLMNDNKGVFGINIGALWRDPDLLRPELETLIEMLADGRIAPVIDSKVPFDHAARAHRRLEQRQNIGKVLLEP